MEETSRIGWHGALLVGGLLVSGCATAPADGVVRPAPGSPRLKSLPGPMPDFGPFKSYSDALIAACSHILSKPNATAGRVQDQDFQLRWRISNEYCAWLYYTPDHQYEMSMLTDQSEPDDLGRKKSCDLPPVVDDPRYPPESLKYVFALHNHPYEDKISDEDIRSILSRGMMHGFETETQRGKVRLSIIAFFSRSSDPAHPTCDGFFQYVPYTSQLLKWTQTRGQWSCLQTGVVRGSSERNFRIEARSAPCSSTDGAAP
jgi:hypothetical protein